MIIFVLTLRYRQNNNNRTPKTSYNHPFKFKKETIVIFFFPMTLMYHKKDYPNLTPNRTRTNNLQKVKHLNLRKGLLRFFFK